MGGKPRKDAGPRPTIEDLKSMSARMQMIGLEDENLFDELVRRGYKFEIPGGDISMWKKGETVVPMQKYVLYVPAESYLYKKKW